MTYRPGPAEILIILLLASLFAGCTATPPPLLKTGSVQVTSSPSGAEVYLDYEYQGTTPVTIPSVAAGSHVVEVRLTGYERWTAPVSVTTGSTATLPALLIPIPATLPVTFAPAKSVTPPPGTPQIHVDGYWTYPPGTDTTTNPVLLLVHTEAFNVGSGDAREVTVSANLWYEGRMVCWNTVYLGTLLSGGHVARDSMVSCTLPSPITSADLSIRFDNLVVSA